MRDLPAVVPEATLPGAAPPAATPGLSQGFSLYLDLLRLGAAMLVLVSHSIGYAGGASWWPGSVGHNAVIIFFVLSGYVIAFVADGKEANAREFWISRFARIYSVAVPALLVTVLADRIGLALQPDFYVGGLTTPDYFWVRLVASLLFVNELWLVSIMPFSNSPYWSLCYEMAYYLLFSIWCFGGRRRWPWLAAAALVIGPKILLLAPIWVLGVVVYRHRAWFAITETSGWLLWGGSIAAIAVFQGWDIGAQLSQWMHGLLGDWLYVRLHFSKHFVGDYLLALLVAAHFVGARRVAGRFEPLLRACAVGIRASASYTLSIYLLHLPLVFLFTILLGGMAPGALRFMLVLCATLLVVIAVGSVTERRKGSLRKVLVRLWPRTSSLTIAATPRESRHA